MSDLHLIHTFSLNISQSNPKTVITLIPVWCDLFWNQIFYTILKCFHITAGYDIDLFFPQYIPLTAILTRNLISNHQRFFFTFSGYCNFYRIIFQSKFIQAPFSIRNLFLCRDPFYCILNLLYSWIVDCNIVTVLNDYWIIVPVSFITAGSIGNYDWLYVIFCNFIQNLIVSALNIALLWIIWFQQEKTCASQNQYSYT